MKQLLKFYNLLIVFLYMFFLQVQAQQENNLCTGAIDISELFIGNCGDQLTMGSFNNIDATVDGNVFPPDFECAIDVIDIDARTSNLSSERTVWFKFSVPDINVDGSAVSYSLWMSDGSFNDNCGLVQANELPSYTKSEIGIYQGYGNCEDFTYSILPFRNSNQLVDRPQWISGWLNANFFPGELYYIAVNTNCGIGEFCLSTIICGIECNDNVCYKIEGYCNCVECQNECQFGDLATVAFQPDDPSTEQDEFLYSFSEDNTDNVFFCSEFVAGYESNYIYLHFGVKYFNNCNGSSQNVNITIDNGNLLNTEININGSYTIGSGLYYSDYIRLSPADIAVGSITITSTVDDGLGNICGDILTLNFADFPQATDPFCEPTCFAGGIDTYLLDNGITVCEGGTFTLSTNGLEDLSLPCYGSNYVYAWRLLADLYQIGDYAVITDWKPLGVNPTIEASSFMIDEHGYNPPNFTPGTLINPESSYGGLISLRIQGAALCLDSDGTIHDGCIARNEGYTSSLVDVIYLPDDGECEVYPGDINSDGIVNNQDDALLFLHYNYSGNTFSRSQQGIDWQPYPSADWGFPVPEANGNDIKHFDCNGNGFINLADKNAIVTNWGLTHNEANNDSSGIYSFGSFPSDTKIYLQPTGDVTGDLLIMDIVLEHIDQTDLEMFGGFFTIQYPSPAVTEANVVFASSWLGFPNSNLNMDYKDFPEQQKVEIGFSRTNGTNATGSGIIGQVAINVNENLRAENSPQVLDFEAIYVGAHNNVGEPIAISDQYHIVNIGAVNCESSITISQATPFQNLYQSSGTISTNGYLSIGQNQEVEYSANRIRLNKGFSIRAGADFKVRFSGCN